MNQNSAKILIFLVLSFGIPWTAALVISQSTMMDNNPAQAAGIANNIFISFPWLANFATRLITREGWRNLWLKPKIRRGWKFYLALWFLPLVATITGGLIFYLVFPRSFDPNMGVLTQLAGSPLQTEHTNPWLLLLTTTLSLFFISVPINTFISLGEEVGWRAYLLQKLMIRFTKPDFIESDDSGNSLNEKKSVDCFYSAGAFKASLLTGLIHGVWHLPLILLTMNLTPGTTILTPVIYLLFTCSLSILLSWGTLNSGSVWPAAIGHGAVNAASVLPGYLLAGQSIALMGPDPTGLIGGIGYTILALFLFFRKGFFTLHVKNSHEK